MMKQKFRGRIKVGTSIMHDFSFGEWPQCRAPRGSVDPDTADDPDMVFDLEWNGRFLTATAPGFGERGNYGNGSIHLFGKQK